MGNGAAPALRRGQERDRLGLIVGVATLAVLAAVWGVRAWSARRTLEAVQDSSRHLGLTPGPAANVHTGTVEGAEVLVGLSMERAPVTAIAKLPTPLGFKLEILHADRTNAATLRTGDQRFDRRAAVLATDERAAEALLASAMLRRRIRLFLERSRRGHATVTDSVVVKNVFDAYRNGAPAVTRALLEVSALAQALSRRELLRRHEAAPTEPERVADLLIERLEQALPGFAELRVSGAASVPAGAPLKKACDFADWMSDAELASLETPKGLPRQPPDAVAPAGLLRVHVECDEGGFHDSRNTWYSYNGYHLTLLVSSDDGEIWDARWERTD